MSNERKSNDSEVEIFKKRKRKDDQEEIEEKRQEALKQMRYLISICEHYSQVFAKNLERANKSRKNQTGKTPTLEDIEGIKTELKNKSPKKKDHYDITQYLTYFEGGKLHPYQVEGVTWLYMLYTNGTNGILADEMGLGKTIQVIALICVLLKQNVTGPFLIVAPLSTLPNWKSEFKKFAPQVPVVVLCGTAQSRAENIKEMFRKHPVGNLTTYPVVIVSFQVPLMESRHLERFKWRYIIVDEGQRIKNHNSMLSRKLRELRSESRLILTGTPLQNNMMELWSLLNFILPNFFTNMETFTQLFMLEDMQDEEMLIKQEESNHLISKIHQVLAPFMLRRLKKNVLKNMVPKKELFIYCPMSDMQIKLYDYVIERNIEALKGNEGQDKELADVDVNAPRPKRRCTQNVRSFSFDSVDSNNSAISEADSNMGKSEQLSINKLNKVVLTMQNIFMMFRKIVSHPYLVNFPLDPNSEQKRLLINEDLINVSGKFRVLETLLPHLLKRGHKILLFSQLCMSLDLIEEFLIMRNLTYRRLDGSTSIEERDSSINTFNNDPNVFIFLLSTRAGGLGLNLVAADTVIFFDRDWNPQVDIQAQDRCHRIGQTKPVLIYTLVSKNTIDERVLKVGNMKRLLERVVISDVTGKLKTVHNPQKLFTKDVLLGLRQALKSKTSEDFYILSNKRELARVLDRSDLYKTLEASKKEE